MKKLSVLVLLTLLVASAEAQDWVKLKDGSKNFGVIQVINDSIIQMKMDYTGNISAFPFSTITKYRFKMSVYEAADPKPYFMKSEPTPGNQLVKAANRYYTGMGITAVGIIVGVALPLLFDDKESDSQAVLDENKRNRKGLIIAGSCVALAGTIINITAFQYIRLAGEMLDIKTSKDGLTLMYKF